MGAVEFTKMHGIGNDFVMLDCREKAIPDLAKKAKHICHRRFGIGCDQIIVVLPSDKADYRMQIFNADGSEVEMCGNGIRCFAKYLWDRDEPIIKEKKTIDVETLAGIIRPTMVKEGLVQVDMGSPILDAKKIPSSFANEMVDAPMKFGRETYKVTLVSMGNPHAIIFTDDVNKVDLATIGPIIENDTKKFPKRINVEFAQIIDKSQIKVRVWERGSGETLACGTGACAVAVAASVNGKAHRKSLINLPGGKLAIKWTDTDKVLMTGAAEEVYNGVINL